MRQSKKAFATRGDARSPGSVATRLTAPRSAPLRALGVLAACGLALGACSRDGNARVDLDLSVTLPPLPEGQGLSLQDASTTAPVALMLRVKGEDGAWQERTLEPGRSSALFEVPPGRVDVEARYVAGRVASALGASASNGASTAEKVAALRERGCAAPDAVGYFLSRGETSKDVSESSRTVSLSLDAPQAVSFVPAGAALKRKSSSGLAAAGGVRLVPLDPAWDVPLPAACPGSHIGQATADAAGIASLRLPEFPGANGTVSLRYAGTDGAASGRVRLPAPSASSLRANLHRVVLDGSGEGLALVERSSDPVKEFGAGFFTELLGEVSAAAICKGATVLGIAGTAECGGPAAAPAPAPAQVPAPVIAACSSDGQVDCLATKEYPALKLVALDPGDIRAGKTVAGISGTLSLPPATAVLSSTTYGPSAAPIVGGVAGCSAIGRTGCYAGVGWTAVESTSLVAGAIKSGVTLGGIAGGYPSATSPLTGDTATADLMSLSPAVSAGAYEFFDSAGTRYTGTIHDAGIVTPSASVQAFNAGVYRQFNVAATGTLPNCTSDGQTNCVTVASYPAAQTAGLASKVLSGQTVAGENGNVVLPSPSNVRSSTSFGPNGTTFGTLAECTADGAMDCVVPSSGTIKAADTAQINGWDIRRKRGPGGALRTFAGIAGQMKSCRNRADTGTYDNSASPGMNGLDVFDTIDDYNGGATGLPQELPPWMIPGVAGGHAEDFACGGIYSTGNTAGGYTGADSTLAHDQNGNWQDLSPGYLPDESASTNSNDGCNATDKFCVFRELVSGLMVTEVSASTNSWQNATVYCDTLGESAHSLSSLHNPIPTIGGATFNDWRLPTQKEAMQLYSSGIRGLNQTSNLTSAFGGLDGTVWTSSTTSYNAANAFAVLLEKGLVSSLLKTNAYKVICVR